MDNNQKFLLFFFVAVCGLTYLAYNYVAPVFVTMTFLLPGVFAIAGYWLSKKLVKPSA